MPAQPRLASRQDRRPPAKWKRRPIVMQGPRGEHQGLVVTVVDGVSITVVDGVSITVVDGVEITSAGLLMVVVPVDAEGTAGITRDAGTPGISSMTPLIPTG